MALTGRITVVALFAFYALMTSATTRFIAPHGSDLNDGLTPGTPMLTADAALLSGADVIVCDSGVYYQHINLRLTDRARITIKTRYSGGKAVFKAPGSTLLSDGSERAEGGRVYSFAIGENVQIHDRNNRLYQEGIPDRNTAITEAERHPLQNGATHRCRGTIIHRCAATSLADALREIEASDSCKWYFDEAQRRIFLSRRVTSSAHHPICYSAGTNLFGGADSGTAVEMSGIEAWYMAINVNDMLQPMLTRCAARYAFSGGGFYWHNATGATFVHCEAESATYGNTGDGFNGHSTEGRHTQATLIHCWAHDNCDDGFSDHERCRSTILGGVFEYNGKAGVTPAYGSHNTSVGVLSRRNFNGFYCVGTVADPADSPGSMTCTDCVSENNTRRPTPLFLFPAREATGYGFAVEGTGNSATIIRCQSISDRVPHHATPGASIKIQ